MSDIAMVRGDTNILNIDVTDASGQTYIPTAADTLTMTVRKGNDKGEIAFQKKSGLDVIATDTGWTVTIQPADTATLEYAGYVYDVEVILGTYVQTIIPMSKFKLEREVTY